MKAVGYLKSLDIEHPDALQNVEMPVPEARGRDLLVKISAISVNPVDTKIRTRIQPDDSVPKVLGWDAVGEVVEVGEQVEFYNVGDKVWYAGDLTRQGTNAEYHLVDERIAGRKPDSLSDAEAVAFPLTAITAWEMLFDRLGLQRKPPNEVHDEAMPEQHSPEQHSLEQQQLLVVGAAGGVGSIMVQLAAQLTGVTVIGTASRPESQQWVRELGADYVIDHRKPLSKELARIGINSVSHVASLNATDQHYDEIVEALAPQGRLGLIDDPQLPLDILKLKMKSLSLHWEFMYTRSMFGTEDMAEQRTLLNHVADLVDAGGLKTTLGAHYGVINAENLKRAHASLESGQTIGKIVLEGF